MERDDILVLIGYGNVVANIATVLLLMRVLFSLETSLRYLSTIRSFQVEPKRSVQL
jgi:hypothetical protein